MCLAFILILSYTQRDRTRQIAPSGLYSLSIHTVYLLGYFMQMLYRMGFHDLNLYFMY
jgi:hypothetical protein